MVFVGIATLIAVWKQANETRKAADATREAAEATKASAEASKASAEATKRSVELQEILQQQWLDISGWGIEGRPTSPNIPLNSLTVVCFIGNPTHSPLIIEKVEANINGDTHRVSTLRNTLSPADEPMRCPFTMQLTEDDKTAYKAYRLNFLIVGLVSYVDCFGKQQEQAFQVNCVCGPAGHENFARLNLAEDLSRK